MNKPIRSVMCFAAFAALALASPCACFAQATKPIQIQGQAITLGTAAQISDLGFQSTTLTADDTFSTDTLTGTAIANGDTVAVGGKTYTFQTSLTNVANNVAVGGTYALSLSNLASAINATPAGSGTAFAAATTANANVKATATATTLVATALVAGATGDVIAATETGSNIAWTAATLLGGKTVIVGKNKSRNYRTVLTSAGVLVKIPLPAPGRFYIQLVQDATGSRTVIWDSTIRWAGGTVPTLTTTASHTDLLEFISNGKTVFGRTFGLNYTE